MEGEADVIITGTDDNALDAEPSHDGIWDCERRAILNSSRSSSGGNFSIQSVSNLSCANTVS